MEYKLISYKNYGFNTTVYFYRDVSTNVMVSPFFESKEEAEEWLKKEKETE